MAKNNATIDVGINVNISLWQAIKWRIAGKAFLDTVVREFKKGCDNSKENKKEPANTKPLATPPTSGGKSRGF